MRLGTNHPNEFIQILNQKNQEIQEAFLEKIKKLTVMIQTKVMLGDGTVTDQKTFDPRLVENFFQEINKKLKGWLVRDVTITNNEDIRRIFTKFEIKEGNYLLSGHLSVQFHVLLYYKPDHRVIDCQKELSSIIDLTKNKEKMIADESDQFVLNKLQEMGYKNLDHQNLFEILYQDDELREKIYGEIQDKSGVDFQKLSKKKQDLFNELDSLLMETYQTSQVLIDDARLVTGEEGCLCTFDLEFIKNKSKEGLFDPKKMSQEIQKKIIKRIEEVYEIIKITYQ